MGPVGAALERVMGIEPTPPAWKAGALPLSYTRLLERGPAAIALGHARPGESVGARGFEPPTSASQTLRASRPAPRPGHDHYRGRARGGQRMLRGVTLRGVGHRRHRRVAGPANDLGAGEPAENRPGQASPAWTWPSTGPGVRRARRRRHEGEAPAPRRRDAAVSKPKPRRQ
jgi:hypothetical protein